MVAQPLRINAFGARAIPATVVIASVSGVVGYVRWQLHKESNTFDRFFATYNTPQSEAVRAKVFDGAREDPRKTLYNILGW